MIPFFRKIRWRLAQNNQFLKYSRYAIGEIVLVVVGILIALSINNWNENRRETLQEVKILKQLKADLIDNNEEILGIDMLVKERLRYSDSILVYLKETRKLDDSLLMYLGWIRNYGIFNSANTAYKYIQSEGMNILSNDSLRDYVTDMYEREFRNIDIRSIGESEIQNYVIEPFVRKNFKPIEDNRLEASVYVKALVQPINIEALYESFEFQNILSQHNAYLKIRKGWLTITLEKLDDLITEVQNEIDRFED